MYSYFFDFTDFIFWISQIGGRFHRLVFSGFHRLEEDFTDFFLGISQIGGRITPMLVNFDGEVIRINHLIVL